MIERRDPAEAQEKPTLENVREISGWRLEIDDDKPVACLSIFLHVGKNLMRALRSTSTVQNTVRRKRPRKTTRWMSQTQECRVPQPKQKFQEDGAVIYKTVSTEAAELLPVRVCQWMSVPENHVIGDSALGSRKPRHPDLPRAIDARVANLQKVVESAGCRLAKKPA